MKHRARLQIEQLENRWCPSAGLESPAMLEPPDAVSVSAPNPSPGPDLPVAAPGPALAAGSEQAVAAAATQKSAVIDFSNLPAAHGGYMFRVYVRAEGREATDTIVVSEENVSPGAIRDLVSDLLESDGWKVKESGDTRLRIIGQVKDGSLSRVTEIIFTPVQGIKKSQLPKVTARTGVKIGQQTQGENWRVAFFPGEGGIEALPQNTVLRVTLNGTHVRVRLTAGMTPDQVASALAGALQERGVDAVLQDSAVEFLSFGGQEEIRRVSVTFTGRDTAAVPPGWLGWGIDIPERTIIEAPG